LLLGAFSLLAENWNCYKSDWCVSTYCILFVLISFLLEQEQPIPSKSYITTKWYANFLADIDTSIAFPQEL